ncbi:MAG TPA: hypothetical protein ENK96_09825 [Desulfobulbaceae bacterium]|nr:hypothetical protein [Desulfobulbaceae bacterium]
MGLFEFIDTQTANDSIGNSILVQERQGQPPEPKPISAENKGMATGREGSQPVRQCHHPAAGDGDNVSLRKNNGHRVSPKPEQLKFLKPCPICGGCDFIHGHEGGFFCISCQPGIEGLPVRALGCRKPQEKAKGLPCSNCGATTYSKEEKGFLFPDGTFTDGWHCGGSSCRVKLLIGNATVDHRIKNHHPESKKIMLSPVGEKQYFETAFPWVQAHLQELLAAGWTRPELFRRDCCAWPLRKWGLCWLPVWKKPDLEIKIESSGRLIFSFTVAGGRRIRQAVFPQHTANSGYPVAQQ